jgi:hypothetical protein
MTSIANLVSPTGETLNRRLAIFSRRNFPPNSMAASGPFSPSSHKKVPPRCEKRRANCARALKLCNRNCWPFFGAKPIAPRSRPGRANFLLALFFSPMRSFCVAEWEFRRIVCPGCGEEDHTKLPVYTAEEMKHVRVEACDSCRTYIKTVDMTKSGRAEPMVDELAAIPLDLWAQTQGYTKLQLNLLQL